MEVALIRMSPRGPLAPRNHARRPPLIQAHRSSIASSIGAGFQWEQGHACTTHGEEWPFQEWVRDLCPQIQAITIPSKRGLGPSAQSDPYPLQGHGTWDKSSCADSNLRNPGKCQPVVLASPFAPLASQTVHASCCRFLEAVSPRAAPRLSKRSSDEGWSGTSRKGKRLPRQPKRRRLEWVSLNPGMGSDPETGCNPFPGRNPLIRNAFANHTRILRSASPEGGPLGVVSDKRVPRGTRKKSCRRSHGGG